MASDDSEMNEAMSMCLVMLKEECGKDDMQLALQTMLRILRNVEQNPTTDKFRTIRKENKAFNEKVWRWDSAQQFLYAVAWIDIEDNIVLPENDNVHAAITILEQTLKKYWADVEVTGHNVQTSNKEKMELSEKDKQLAENRRQLMERLKRDKEEKERLKEQIKADRRDVSTRETKDSKARQLQHGGTMTKFEDIGIDLNKGGG